MLPRRLVTSALAVATAVVLSVPALAQDANLRSITFYKVKADRVDDFAAALKDYRAVLAKAKAPRALQVYHRLTGSREYVLVSARAKYGDFGVRSDALKDFRGELNRVIARLDGCVESSQRIVDERMGDLSLAPPATPAKMLRTLQIRVRPEKVNDYMALVKSELLPAIKKAGKSYITYRSMYGSSRFEFRSSMGLEGWADLDEPNPVAKAMGGMDAYNKYLAKVSPMVTFVEYNISEYMPELSYVPGT